MKEKVCVTTFVFGEKYQGYIPLLIYSLLKAYPEYMPIIFVHESLKIDIKNQLEKLKHLGDFIIKDNYFNEFEKLNNFEGKSLRWLIRDEEIMKYDYAYFVDIDILYIREEPELHIQHIEHMKSIGLPFSNSIRKKEYNNRNPKFFAHRIKTYGIKNAIINLLKGKVTEQRLTGLHFIKTNEYFKVVKKQQKLHMKLLKTNEYLKYYQGYSNETVLYKICKDSGFNFNKIGQYSDETSLDFKNYFSPGFRPHHGIHLGLFRKSNKITQINDKAANSSSYKHYIKSFKDYLNDPIFLFLLENADPFIKNHFRIMFKFYNFQPDLPDLPPKS